MSSCLLDFDEMVRETHPGHERWRITWHLNIMRLGCKRVSLAICAKTGGVAFMARDMVHPLIVHDVLADSVGKTCEDGARCLDISCPYNCAKPNKLQHYGIRNYDDIVKLHQRLQEILGKLQLKNAEPHTTIAYTVPAVTIKEALT